MIKVSMPSWHEDARRMRNSGMRNPQIVMALAEAGIKVSESRVSQVTNKRWEQYLPGAIKERKEQQEARLKENTEMSNRAFEKVTASDPSDVYHRVKVRCGHNGCVESMVFARRGVINPDQAARWFRDKGWGIGGSPRADLCPAHFRGLHNGKQLQAEEVTAPSSSPSSPPASSPTSSPSSASMPPPTPTPPAASPSTPSASPSPASPSTPPPSSTPTPTPSTLSKLRLVAASTPTPSSSPSPTLEPMTRVERRIIFAKLSDVYDDEKSVYRGDWSDAKVAADLGVSVQWVKEIRDENFGSEDVNEVETGISEKLDLIASEIVKIEQEIEEYDKMVERLDARLDQFELMKAEVLRLSVEHKRGKPQ